MADTRYTGGSPTIRFGSPDEMVNGFKKTKISVTG
jgi:hypothetical protein